MAINIENILNIDIDNYLRSKCRGRAEYNLIGVHCDKKDIKEFAALVPDKAEAVVNYQKQFFGAGAGAAPGCTGPIQF